MDSNVYVATHKELNEAFDSGSIFSATPQEQERFLRHLGYIVGNPHILGDQAQSTNIIRALTINHLQMARTICELESTIKKLNAENGKVSSRVLILTWVCAICGAIQVFGVFWMIFRDP
jgi:hypothetical protein